MRTTLNKSDIGLLTYRLIAQCVTGCNVDFRFTNVNSAVRIIASRSRISVTMLMFIILTTSTLRMTDATNVVVRPTLTWPVLCSRREHCDPLSRRSQRLRASRRTQVTERGEESVRRHGATQCRRTKKCRLQCRPVERWLRIIISPQRMKRAN